MESQLNSSSRPDASLVDLIRRHGGPVSHAALDATRSIYRAPDIDGVIGYLSMPGCVVVLGDPICAPADKPALADAFAACCADRKQKLIYAAASASLCEYARARQYASIEFASLLMADARHDPEEGPKARHLRQNLNHLRRMGVVVREYMGESSADPELEAGVSAAFDAWVAGRSGPQMYLGRPRLFDDRFGRRWFVAERAGQIVGMLSMLQAGGVDGANLINIVFSSPGAPSHTNELMVVSALRALREEACGPVCLGIGPLATLGQIEGCGVAGEYLARGSYRLAAKLGHLPGKTVFWRKFCLTTCEPLYLLFQSPHIGWQEILALLRTFNFSVV